MAKETNKTKLKFFGIGRIVPYLAKLKKLIVFMVFFGLMGSLTDIILPLFQRYALDHYVGLGTFDTIGIFLVLYVIIMIVRNHNKRKYRHSRRRRF